MATVFWNAETTERMKRSYQVAYNEDDGVVEIVRNTNGWTEVVALIEYETLAEIWKRASGKSK